MALSIGISQGSRIKIGTKTLNVDDLSSSKHVSVTYGGQRYLITDAQRTKIDDEVFVSCGDRGHKSNEKFTRLAFEAPRHVPITRV